MYNVVVDAIITADMIFLGQSYDHDELSVSQTGLVSFSLIILIHYHCIMNITFDSILTYGFNVTV